MFGKKTKVKDVEQKKEIKYVLSGLIILLLLLFLLGLYGYNSLFKDTDVRSRMSLSLSEKKIGSGEETKLLVKLTNTGNLALQGSINASSQSANVNISYPEQELLKIKLLPEETITRILIVTASSDSIRTDYELFVELINLEEDTGQRNFKKIISNSKIILTVEQ